MLGDGFAGVLVSDFDAAYDRYPGLKQRCCAHLLREIYDLKAQHPDDVELSRWTARVKDVYTKATAVRHRDPRKRYAAQRRFKERLLALCRPYTDDPSAVQGKLCSRSIEQLFVLVGEPRVPTDNNGSERSLRHLVISQKVSGGHALCTRDREQDGLGLPVRHLAEPGASTPLIACRRMLPSPQLLLRHRAVQGRTVSRIVYYRRNLSLVRTRKGRDGDAPQESAAIGGRQFPGRPRACRNRVCPHHGEERS